MSRYYDAYIVPYTCPYLDYIKNALEDPENADVNLAIEYVEIVRTHNGNLREYALNYGMEADKFEVEIGSLEETLDIAREDLGQLKEECRRLENQIYELENTPC